MNALLKRAMRSARTEGLPDSAIGRRYDLTRQRVHQILGKRPPAPRKAQPAAPPAPTREEFAAAKKKLQELISAKLSKSAALEQDIFSIGCAKAK